MGGGASRDEVAAALEEKLRQRDSRDYMRRTADERIHQAELRRQQLEAELKAQCLKTEMERNVQKEREKYFQILREDELRKKEAELKKQEAENLMKKVAEDQRRANEERLKKVTDEETEKKLSDDRKKAEMQNLDAEIKKVTQKGITNQNGPASKSILSSTGTSHPNVTHSSQFSGAPLNQFHAPGNMPCGPTGNMPGGPIGNMPGGPTGNMPGGPMGPPNFGQQPMGTQPGMPQVPPRFFTPPGVPMPQGFQPFGMQMGGPMGPPPFVGQQPQMCPMGQYQGGPAPWIQQVPNNFQGGPNRNSRFQPRKANEPYVMQNQNQPDQKQEEKKSIANTQNKMKRSQSKDRAKNKNDMSQNKNANKKQNEKSDESPNQGAVPKNVKGKTANKKPNEKTDASPDESSNQGAAPKNGKGKTANKKPNEKTDASLNNPGAPSKNVKEQENQIPAQSNKPKKERHRNNKQKQGSETESDKGATKKNENRNKAGEKKSRKQKKQERDLFLGKSDKSDKVTDYLKSLEASNVPGGAHEENRVFTLKDLADMYSRNSQGQASSKEGDLKELADMFSEADSESNCSDSTKIAMNRRKLATLQALLEKVKNSPKDSPAFSEEFLVEEELMRYAIGPKGAKINAAREIDGVTRIDNEGGRFIVHGETKEAVAKARALLEYTEDIMLVETDYVGRIIGKSGKIIDEIVERSGVIKVRVDDKKEGCADTGFSVLVIVGTVECIAKAMNLISVRLSQAKELEKLHQHKQAIDLQVKKKQGSVNDILKDVNVEKLSALIENIKMSTSGDARALEFALSKKAACSEKSASTVRQNRTLKVPAPEEVGSSDEDSDDLSGSESDASSTSNDSFITAAGPKQPFSENVHGRPKKGRPGPSQKKQFQQDLQPQNLPPLTSKNLGKNRYLLKFIGVRPLPTKVEAQKMGIKPSQLYRKVTGVVVYNDVKVSIPKTIMDIIEFGQKNRNSKAEFVEF